MKSNVLISVKIPGRLNEQLAMQIVKDGYGLRGKSRWLCEAIEKFIELKDFVELIEVASESLENTKSISFRISEELLNKMQNSIITARKQNPLLDAVQSNLVRAGIYQRLIRG